MKDNRNQQATIKAVCSYSNKEREREREKPVPGLENIQRKAVDERREKMEVVAKAEKREREREKKKERERKKKREFF